MAPDVATTLPRPALAGHVGRYRGVRTRGAPEQRTEPSVPGTALILALERDWWIGTGGDAPELRPDVAWAARRLQASGGRLPIEELQRELRCSRRHLSTRFREAVGVGPKAYARLIRFDRAQHLLRDRSAGLSEIALACGFSDQAHLTREVRAFAGTTPGQLRAQAVRPQQVSPGAGDDGAPRSPAARDAVTSVQDPAPTPT